MSRLCYLARLGLLRLPLRAQRTRSSRAFCQSYQTTALFVVLLTAFRATHYRLTGSEDATIGTPIAES